MAKQNTPNQNSGSMGGGISLFPFCTLPCSSRVGAISCPTSSYRSWKQPTSPQFHISVRPTWFLTCTRPGRKGKRGLSRWRSWNWCSLNLLLMMMTLGRPMIQSTPLLRRASNRVSHLQQENRWDHGTMKDYSKPKILCPRVGWGHQEADREGRQGLLRNACTTSRSKFWSSHVYGQIFSIRMLGLTPKIWSCSFRIHKPFLEVLPTLLPKKGGIDPESIPNVTRLWGVPDYWYGSLFYLRPKSHIHISWQTAPQPSIDWGIVSRKLPPNKVICFTWSSLSSVSSGKVPEIGGAFISIWGWTTGQQCSQS